MRKAKRFPWLIAALFLFSLFIACNVPYTHDDWDWGRQIGVHNWLTGTFNNRYVGTFFVIVMTRLPLVKTLVMAAAMTLLPLVCAELAPAEEGCRSRKWLTVLCCFLCFAMPLITWRQTYGWVAGFSNFTMGALAMLSLLLLLKRVRSSAPAKPVLVGIGAFALAFAAQLFSENISLFLPIFLVCALVLTRFWRDRRVCTVFLWALLGTLLGAFVMFFNPLYQDLASTGAAEGQFRSLTFSPQDPIPVILGTLLGLLFGEILPSLYETHPVVVLFLSAAVWIDLAPRSKKLAAAFGVPMAVYGLGCLYCAGQMDRTFGWLPASALLRTVGAVVFTVLLFAAILCSPRRSKWHTMAFFLLALALITPFCAIRHMGPRCYHISHFCLIVAGCSCLAHREFHPGARAAVGVCLAATVLSLGQAYWAIGSCSAIREELLQQARQGGTDTLVLPSVDGRYTYSWGYNPQSPLRAEHYREFYGLPADMELIFLPYGTAELWPEIPEDLYAQAMVYPGEAETP